MLSRGERKPDGNTSIQLYLCRCDCGNTVQRTRATLEKAMLPSCGCARADLNRKLTESRAKPDIAGQRFGRLTVLGKGVTKKRKDGKTRGLWLCRCDCGNEVEYPRGEIENNGRRSCGCLGRERKGKPNIKKSHDYTGQTFGNLTVIERCGSDVWGGKCNPCWLCQCSCGNIVRRSSGQLRQGFARGRNCNDRIKHPELRPRYPATPTPYPAEATEIVQKFLKYTRASSQAVEDEKLDLLMRYAWVVVYRRSQGEEISDTHLRRYIHKILSYGSKIAYWREKAEQNGGITYTMNGYKMHARRRGIGVAMTDSTSFTEAVNPSGETQPDNMLSTPKKRIKFKRC